MFLSFSCYVQFIHHHHFLHHSHMGNCLIRNNQISAHDDDIYDDAVVEQMKTSDSSFKSEPAAAMHEESMKKKKKHKKVSFELQNKDEERNGKQIRSRSGSVRIRLVVTQEELKRILSSENDTQQTSLEQLLSSVKLGGSRICEVTGDDDGAMNAWRPALDSIPEDISQ
ncbi:uncharacterized protein LOC129312439 [Prosopis cineraria]|uniref:uncharacterized protein LOC129300355 n=1 Tax=Prosopis cineraria TaxID=364024 RepID=UPI002410B529|nr:uncharacterized protein LOC129300355 [Prosopis cineraria]XP_054811038.1 uncharacterized protein LOC129312439 [Prosopis cineraria]